MRTMFVMPNLGKSWAVAGSWETGNLLEHGGAPGEAPGCESFVDSGTVIPMHA